MKVWDEDFVVKQLAAARKKATAFQNSSSGGEDGGGGFSDSQSNAISNNNQKPQESPVAFLLVLVRKFEHKHYEFIYIAANCYEKVEKVYNKTNVVLTHANDQQEADDKECGVWIGRSAEQEDQQKQQQQNLLLLGGDDDEDEDEQQQKGEEGEEEEQIDFEKESETDSGNESNDDIFFDSNEKENSNNNIDNSNSNLSSAFKINTKFESYHVGKAIFHTASGEPLMKMEGSTGWKEAMKQKYQILDARSRVDPEKKPDEKNHTAAKAMAAAALGGGAAAAGGSVVAASTAAAATTAAIEAGTAYGAGAFAASGGFGAGYYGAGAGLAGYGASYGAASGLGYGAAGYGASYGAGYGAASGLGYGAAGYGAGATGASSWAGWAAANGIAAGGTSSAASAGATTAAAGVMAPVGVIAAAGAATGLGIYYVIHRRNQARKAREKAVQEGVPSAEKIHEEDSTVVTEEECSSDGEAPSGYLPLSCDNEHPEGAEDYTMNLWVSLFAKRVDDDDNHCVFVPVVCANRVDAEREWMQAPDEAIIAKALFDPEGKVVELQVDPTDHDGWETALALHYDFLEDHNVITCLVDDEETEEDAPLLENEPKVTLRKQQQQQQQQQPNKTTNNNVTERAPPTNGNWVFEAIRTKRQQISNIRVPGPGAILANIPRPNKASAQASF